MTLFHATCASPIGSLLLTSDGSALVGLDLGSRDPWPGSVEDPEPLAEALAQLEAYFQGTLRTFDLPLAASGTPFQAAVWRALGAIPYGETRTYGEIAAEIGRPGAARAVGAANRANPIAIVVPCHRVIGQGGNLVGYAGGLERKRFLIAFERAATSRVQVGQSRMQASTELMKSGRMATRISRQSQSPGSPQSVALRQALEQ